MTIRPSGPRPTDPTPPAPRAGDRTPVRASASSDALTEVVELSPAAQAALAREGEELLGATRFREVMAFLSPERQLDPVVLRDVAIRMAESLADETSGGI